MKKITTILLVNILCISASAQKFQTAEDIEVWEENEIESARKAFRNDSIDFMTDRTERLNQKIKDIRLEAGRRKKKLGKKSHPADVTVKDTADNTDIVDSTHTAERTDTTTAKDSLVKDTTTIQPNDGPTVETPPMSPDRENPSNTPKTGNTIASYQKGCKEYLRKLRGDGLSSTRRFFQDFLAANDDINQYLLIKEDLSECLNLLRQHGSSIAELESFIADLKVIELADSVLRSPYNKPKRVEAQNKLKNIKSFTARQEKCALIDSLRHGLDIYYLSTSNMMDLIDEIKDCHTRYYKEGSHEEERTAIANELRSNIDFEARVNNFRNVKYMSDMYDKVVREILHRDEEGNFDFDKFDMDDLERIKTELEAMRQTRIEK